MTEKEYVYFQGKEEKILRSSASYFQGKRSYASVTQTKHEKVTQASVKVTISGWKPELLRSMSYAGGL
jgi:hypothetical protein